MSFVRWGSLALGLSCIPSLALAEDTPPAEDVPAPEASDEAGVETDEPAPASDEAAPAAAPVANEPMVGSSGGGMKLHRRRGIAAMVGIENVSDDFGNSLSAPMGGIDVRLGTQIGDVLGIYAPLHLAFGSFQGLGTVGGVPAGLTGTFAATVVVDATLMDRFFVGGGGGLGVLNNPMGPCFHLRFGGYPIMTRPAGKDFRRGMSVSADIRVISAQGLSATYPSLTVGWEAF
ncbi:MAG: hypothetical protein H6734_27550 [Alphaproteobacteria bacterium]|nr:hypothetical protein [Alphaproteobacteria bacterium]MCB9688138.1 hypothetical protein [Alphaproteobacteria bacterium]